MRSVEVMVFHTVGAVEIEQKRSHGIIFEFARFGHTAEIIGERISLGCFVVCNRLFQPFEVGFAVVIHGAERLGFRALEECGSAAQDERTHILTAAAEHGVVGNTDTEVVKSLGRVNC